MLFTHGDTQTITSQTWYMLELWTERTSEEVIKRICAAMPRIFEQDAAELFVPVTTRDLDVFDILTESYLFIRSNDRDRIAKVRDVSGVQRIMASGDTDRPRPSKFLPVEDSYVQELIARCQKYRLERAAKVHVGGFVRILDGEERDYCGHVTAIHNGRVMVEVHLKTKILFVETSLYNLLDISDVPEEQRVFYYCPSVKTFAEEQGEEAAKMLAEDLRYNEDVVKEFLSPEDDCPALHTVERTSITKNHRSREQTTTRFVKSLIEGGERDVKVLLAKTVEAIQARAIFCPKNSTTLWHALRSAIVDYMFKDDPLIKTYTDIEKVYGKHFQLTPTDVITALPTLPTKKCPAAKSQKKAPVAQLPVQEIHGSLKLTITAIIRMRFAEGAFDVRGMIPALIAGVAAGKIRPARHAHAFQIALRSASLKFFKDQGTPINARELAAMHGEGAVTTLGWLKEHFPDLDKVMAEHYTRALPKIKEKVTTLLDANPVGIIPADKVPPRVQSREKIVPLPSNC